MDMMVVPVNIDGNEKNGNELTGNEQIGNESSSLFNVYLVPSLICSDLVPAPPHPSKRCASVQLQR